MSNPTAGPWEWDGKFTVCIPHRNGLTCFRTNPEDARLIAAAPDMLKALQAASMALKSYACGNAATDLAEEVAQFCEAALSKALGDQP